MYFSFDGNTEGFEEILSRIADNHDGGKHNHKEVRAYARCLLSILPEINCGFSVKPEVQILLAALTASGLPHYDRAFLATCILKLLSESVNSKAKSTAEDTTDGVPF
jgi:hypothetical protein